jgi:hypothetical protein
MLAISGYNWAHSTLTIFGFLPIGRIDEQEKLVDIGCDAASCRHSTYCDCRALRRVFHV